MAMGVSFRSAPARPSTVAAEAMVATSQPVATRAGLRMLERGGNAVDAAIASAAVLCIAEPMSTGIGGDAFALLSVDGGLVGLDSAGPAPAAAGADEPVARFGPRSITVPGAVAGWAALSGRFGRLGLDACLADAISAAERGVAVAPRCAESWERAERTPAEIGPPPRVGERYRLPDLGATLRKIAEEGPDAFYRGPVAEAIASTSWLSEDDLAAYAVRWVEPLRVRYRGRHVAELPPPTQGVAVLEGLALLDGFEPTLAAQIACVGLALEDAFRSVRDGADVRRLLDPTYLEQRRREAPPPVAEAARGTVYLCAVDGDRTAVSFIQSLYEPFGSGIVAPGTGVVLQNRGAGFSVSGRVEPGRRPYHTLIPGMLLDTDGGLLGPFGVMGGLLQAQAHVQLVSALVDEGLDPQAALDRPRFRLDGRRILLEDGLGQESAELESSGLELVPSSDLSEFGGGQVIMVHRDVLLGGSDARKDGHAAGF